MLKKYFSLNPWFILAFILLIELVFNLVLKSMVLNEKVIFNSLAEKMTIEEINTLLSSFKANSFLILLFSVLQPLFEIVLIAISVNIGTLFTKLNFGFQDILGIVIKAFVFFSISRIAFIIALYYHGVTLFDDLNYIPHWSIADLIGSSSLASWALYPLQILNIFQAGFMFLLIYGLNSWFLKGYRWWSGMVFCTYGVGLLILVVIVGFLTAL